MAARASHYLRLRRFLSTPSMHNITFSEKQTIKPHLSCSGRFTGTLNLPCHLHYNHHCRSLSGSTPNNPQETKAEGINFTLEHENVQDYHERREITTKIGEEKIIEIDRSEFTEEVPFTLPNIGVGSRGRIAKWHHKEGAVLQQGDTLCDIETEMFTFSIDIDDECLGILEKQFQPVDGEFFDPGTTLCMILHKPV